jgi:hypothetical protein
MIPLTTCWKANGRKCSRGIRLRPLLEGALMNEYRFKWTAFPAVKGYLPMYPGDFCKIFPRGRWIIKTARHVSAVIDATIHDTFRPDPFRCIYGAWQLIRVLNKFMN